VPSEKELLKKSWKQSIGKKLMSTHPLPTVIN
jgi:hypothetical protein